MSYVESLHRESRYNDCRTAYDEAFTAAVTARTVAIDEVIVGFARQTRADPARVRALFTRYLAARASAARDNPLPRPRRC